MRHLFFLTSPDKELGVDISVSELNTSHADETFDLMKNAAPQENKELPPVQVDRLRDGSEFHHFLSMEKGPKGTHYFLQGVLRRNRLRFYVLFSSPKALPTPEQKEAIHGALTTLHREPTTVGGKPKPNPHRDSTVIDIGPDKSVLTILKPWTIDSWGYTARRGLGTFLHSFQKGPIRAELCLAKGNQGNRTASDLAHTLAAGYQKSAKSLVEVQTKKLSNGLNIHYLLIEHPNLDGERHLILEGFFKRGDADALAYYFIAAAPRKAMETEHFEHEAVDALRVLGTLRW